MTTAWGNFGNAFPAPATVSNPLCYQEVEKIWWALRERGRVVNGGTPFNEWPDTGFVWWDGTSASITFTSGKPTLVRCQNPDGSYPSWPSTYWTSSAPLGGAPVPGRPNQFDIIFDSDVPEGCYRCQIENTHTPPSEWLVLAPPTGPAPDTGLWNGRIFIIRRYAEWWSDKWPKWPTASDPKAFPLLWYSGEVGGTQYCSMDPNTGAIGPMGLPSTGDTYSAPTGEGGNCESNPAYLFDNDFYTGRPDDNDCQPDQWLNPNVYKSFRGAQVAAEHLSGSFVRDRGPGGYNGWAKYNIDVLTPAEWFYAAGINGWSGTTGTPDGSGKLPVPGLGCAIPPDWGTLSATNKRPVYYTIISDGNPSPRYRSQSGLVIDAGIAEYDGTYLYGSGFDEDVPFTDAEPLKKKYENQQIYLSFGWTRTIKRQFRYLYPREIWIPDTVEDEDTGDVSVVDPPTDDHPGTWVVRPASTHCLMYFEPLGIVTDDADAAFAEGMRARYKGDVYGEANVRMWPGDFTIAYDTEDPDPLLDHYARFCTFKRKGAIAAGTVHGVGGSTFVDKDNSWDTRYERQVWKGRDVTLVDLDGTEHTGAVVTGSVNTSVTVDGVTTTGTTFTFTGGVTPAAGWTYKVVEYQPGDVLEWDGTRWLPPTSSRVGESDISTNLTTNEPDQTFRFGRVMNEDVFPGQVLAELRRSIDALIVTKYNVGWSATTDPSDHTTINEVFANIPDVDGVTFAGDVVAPIHDRWAAGYNDEFVTHDQSSAPPEAYYRGYWGTGPGGEALYRYSYGHVNGLPTLFTSTREFLNFAELNYDDDDPYLVFIPPQVEAIGDQDPDAPNPYDWEFHWEIADPSYYTRQRSGGDFDANGFEVSYRKWTQWSTITGSSAPEQYSAALGDTSIPEPDVCDTPFLTPYQNDGPDDHRYDDPWHDENPAPDGQPHSGPFNGWLDFGMYYRGFVVSNGVCLVRNQFTYVADDFAG